MPISERVIDAFIRRVQADRDAAKRRAALAAAKVRVWMAKRRKAIAAVARGQVAAATGVKRVSSKKKGPEGERWRRGRYPGQCLACRMRARNGCRTEFKRKAHEAFVTLLTSDVTLTDATSHITFPDWLRTENSCLRAVYCLMKDDEAAIEHIKTRWGRLGLAEIISFQQDPVTIESVMVAWKMKPWRPYVGYTLDFIGTAVLMVTIEQEPACVGLCINRDDSAIVYTGTSCITLSKNQLEAKLAASTDRFMMTTYIVSISRGSFPGREDESKDDAYKRLLHCKCR